nr:TetR/AcrR family transcriptional regulator [Actinomadura sp. CNU-125]
MAPRASGDEPASPPPGREQTRLRVIEATIDLLARAGRDAVTTRAVADAAGLQPPAIYRLFGDKDGLLDAVAEHGFAAFLAAKRVDPAPPDPVADLAAGWDLAVEFGLDNPALYTVMYSEPTRTGSAAFETGMEILKGRIRRIAAAGRLRVGEDLAATIVHATARGAVLTWLSLPEDRRDPALLTALRESMVTAVTTERPAVREAGAAGAARAARRAARADVPQPCRAAAAPGMAGPPRRGRMMPGSCERCTRDRHRGGRTGALPPATLERPALHGSHDGITTRPRYRARGPAGVRRRPRRASNASATPSPKAPSTRRSTTAGCSGPRPPSPSATCGPSPPTCRSRGRRSPGGPPPARPPEPRPTSASGARSGATGAAAR